MGFKCSMLALSRVVPREEIGSVAEGGPAAAVDAVEALWPGRWRLSETASLTEARRVCLDCLWVGTWGDTLLLVNTDPYELCDDQAFAEDGRGVWLLVSHEASNLAAYRTPAAYLSRDVTLDADSDADDLHEALAGEVLAFEAPYAAGERRGPNGDPFDPVDLARSALDWVFGLADPDNLPMHRFEPVASARRALLWRQLS